MHNNGKNSGETMRFLYTLLSLLLVLSLFSNEKITLQLLEEMSTKSDDELIEVNILLSEEYDDSSLKSIIENKNKSERRKIVVDELKSFHSASQSALVSFLEDREFSGKADDVHQLWITNVVNCKINKGTIEEISHWNSVLSIDFNEGRKILDEREWANQRLVEGDAASRELTWNVTNVSANQVWDLGYTGQGIIVAVLDTGVNYNHSDLTDHVWNDPAFPNHGYDFHNGDNNPMDDHGHGTHCAGTVAGDGTAGSQTGIAPDATIMALKILGGDGSGEEANVWEALEFAVEHGADVMSMSIGWQHSWGTNREAWREAMENVLLAGVIAAVAAGNEGDQQYSYPIPDNVRTPGDCPPPWLHPDQTLAGGLSAVVCVGATDSGNGLAGFSGRGPVTWETIASYNDYPHQPEMGLIRPDISAPGVSIKSLDYSYNSGYADGWDGTSMATPCVAGVMALMLSKNPQLLPHEIDEILETTCSNAPVTKNNQIGSGIVNALQAVNTVTISQTPPNAANYPVPANLATGIFPDTQIRWLNGGGATSYTLHFGTDYPPSNILADYDTNENIYDFNTPLSYNTQYYWKVDSQNDYGITEGEIWTFTTGNEPWENFETGDFTNLPWTFAGNSNWQITSNNVFEGQYSAKSGNIAHSQSSSLLLNDVVLPDETTISFYLKTSCEPVGSQSGTYYDYLSFYIDGEEQDKWAGETNWQQTSYELSAGLHNLEWKYTKDTGVVAGSDCVWIDYICLNLPAVELSAPIDLTAQVIANEQIFLSWNMPEDYQGTLQSFKVLLGEWILADSISADNMMYSHEDLDAGYYEYYVIAVYEEGNSQPSQSAFAEIIPEYQVDVTTEINIMENEDFESAYFEIKNLSNTYLSIDEMTMEGSVGTAGWSVIPQGVEGWYLPYYIAADDTLRCFVEFSLPSLRDILVDSIRIVTTVDTQYVHLYVESGLVHTDDISVIPVQTEITGNYPNPFNPTTTVKFSLSEASATTIEVYNIKGEKVKTLLNESLLAGNHIVIWNGKNSTDQSVSSGVYFIRMTTDNTVSVRKTMLLK